MNETPLSQRHCESCTPETPVLAPEVVQSYLAEVPEWRLSKDGRSLQRGLRLRNFMAAIDLVNRIAALAEAEQHHPDLRIHGYRNLDIELSTHAIGGLSDNDFILAAHLDEILSRRG